MRLVYLEICRRISDCSQKDLNSEIQPPQIYFVVKTSADLPQSSFQFLQSDFYRYIITFLSYNTISFNLIFSQVYLKSESVDLRI